MRIMKITGMIRMTRMRRMMMIRREIDMSTSFKAFQNAKDKVMMNMRMKKNNYE